MEAQIPKLRRYARALIRSAGRADDLVWETLHRALCKQQLWAPGADVPAWPFTNVDCVRRTMPDDSAVEIGGGLQAGCGQRQAKEGATPSR